MLPFGVTIPATVLQGLEIPEGLMNRKERITRVQHGRQRNCHPRQGYFRDDMGSEMSRKYLCSRQQLCWRVELVEWDRVR